MREQYEYQLAVAEELARAVKMRGQTNHVRGGFT
jgi:hypothetical protein